MIFDPSSGMVKEDFDRDLLDPVPHIRAFGLS
jgi:hypothetical protein